MQLTPTISVFFTLCLSLHTLFCRSCYTSNSHANVLLFLFFCLSCLFFHWDYHYSLDSLCSILYIHTHRHTCLFSWAHVRTHTPLQASQVPAIFHFWVFRNNNNISKCVCERERHVGCQSPINIRPFSQGIRDPASLQFTQLSSMCKKTLLSSSLVFNFPVLISSLFTSPLSVPFLLYLLSHSNSALVIPARLLCTVRFTVLQSPLINLVLSHPSFHSFCPLWITCPPLPKFQFSRVWLAWTTHSSIAICTSLFSLFSPSLHLSPDICYSNQRYIPPQGMFSARATHTLAKCVLIGALVGYPLIYMSRPHACRSSHSWPHSKRPVGGNHIKVSNLCFREPKLHKGRNMTLRNRTCNSFSRCPVM